MDIKDFEHIVVGGEHYNPLGVIRSLGEYDLKPIFISINSANSVSWVSHSKYISKVYQVKTIDEALKVLLECKFDTKKSFIYTCDDQVESLFDRNYDKLKDRYYFFNARKKDVITYYMDKMNILNLAKENGLDILNTVVVKKGEVPRCIEYPIITKAIVPTIGNWKADSYICNSEEELLCAYKGIKSENVLIQKYIEKKNELCIDGVSLNHGKDVFYAISSKYNYLLRDTYSPLMHVDLHNDEVISKQLNDMFLSLGFEGIFSVEYLIDKDDKLYFSEINFRNSTWSYASTVAGMNLPVIWAQGTLDGYFASSHIKNGKANFDAVVELHDYVQRVKKQKISIFRWLVSICKIKCKYMIGRNDIRPILHLFFGLLNRKVRRMIKK